MVISYVLGSYVDRSYSYSRTKPPRCSTVCLIFQTRFMVAFKLFIPFDIFLFQCYPKTHLNGQINLTKFS